MPILDMKEFQEFKKKKISARAEELKERGIIPTLYIITDDVNPRTQTYMKSKLSMADKLGIKAEKIIIKSKEQLMDLTFDVMLNGARTICQLPISKEIEEEYMNKISYFDDVDGFNQMNKVFYDDYSNIPATPKGIMEHLEYIDYDLRGKTVVIVGRGNLVGKPLATLMMNKGATVVVVNSKTDSCLRDSSLAIADIVICATGIKGSVKTSELSDTKVVLVYNVGTCFDKNGKLTTELEVDCEKDNIKYTDRIGAVGVCTVLSLLDNVVNSYPIRKKGDLSDDEDGMGYN